MGALRTYRDLLTDLPFLGLALMSAFYLGAMFTYVASSTFVFQEGYGMTAQQFGWVFAGGAVAITAGSQVNGALVGRFTPEQVLSATVVTGLGLSSALFVTTLVGGPLWLILTLLIATLGTAGFVLPSAPAIALASNPHRAGSAAALLGALQFGLGAVIAPLTSIGGSPTAESMTAVMAGVILIAALLLVGVRRSWKRLPASLDEAPAGVGRAGAVALGAASVDDELDALLPVDSLVSVEAAAPGSSRRTDRAVRGFLGCVGGRRRGRRCRGVGHGVLPWVILSLRAPIVWRTSHPAT